MVAHPNRAILLTATLLGASAVMLGAFGTHALRQTLGAQQLGWWQTATQYQLGHAIALLVIATLPLRRAPVAAGCIALGTIIFSASLYLMALGLPRWLGAITPIGGVLLIAGWLVLGWSALERSESAGR